MAGIVTSMDPLGSVIVSRFKKNQVLGEIANPQSADNQWFYVDIPDMRSVIYANIVGGGNTSQWCYYGCYHAGSAASVGCYLIFNTRCRLRVGVGLNQQPSRLQVAEWGKDTWYDLIICDPGGNASGGGNGGGGRPTVNTASTFNTYKDIIQVNGNGGSQNGYGASVWGGYGSGGTNGYGKLTYIGDRI